MRSFLPYEVRVLFGRLFVVIDDLGGIESRRWPSAAKTDGGILFRLLFAILDLYRYLHTCTTNGAYLLERRVAILVSKEA